MKIALINGSPKAKNSASNYLVQTLKGLLANNHEIAEFHLRGAKPNQQDFEGIAGANVLVFAFPLYIDGIPSHLINCLYELERFLIKEERGDITVYSLVNGGFYEGHQNAIALDMMKNWCVKAKLKWGQGVGIGGGGMIPMLSGFPDDKGPKKNSSIAIKTIVGNISTSAAADNIYISPSLPRIAYKLAAEMNWRQQIKANGLKTRDLSMRKI